MPNKIQPPCHLGVCDVYVIVAKLKALTSRAPMLSRLALLAAFLSVAPAQAALLSIDFVGPQLPPNSTAVTLPFLLNNVNDVLFFKYKVPDIQNVVSIQSLTVTIQFLDDDDGGMESGFVDFALPSTNLFLAGFFENLRPYTPGAPKTLTASLCACEIDQVLPSMLDGNFRIRISRESGDFYVVGGTVEIDATLAPEPASAVFAGAGLLALGGIARRRTRRTGPQYIGAA